MNLYETLEEIKNKNLSWSTGVYIGDPSICFHILQKDRSELIKLIDSCTHDLEFIEEHKLSNCKHPEAYGKATAEISYKLPGKPYGTIANRVRKLLRR